MKDSNKIGYNVTYNEITKTLIRVSLLVIAISLSLVFKSE